VTNYELSHLSQEENQRVMGPIQDDEALLLYSVIRVMRLKNIVEIGAARGYSAINFLKAIGNNGNVVSIDITPTPIMGDRHIVLVGSAEDVTPEQLQVDSIDLLFFDAHDYPAQINFFNTMRDAGMITDSTIIALHDTGTHPVQFGSSYETNQGFVHQKVERVMTNNFFDMGYQPICFHTKLSVHDETLPYRHGLTLLSKFNRLSV
jgi:predicted O-methyltransferase YrrM